MISCLSPLLTFSLSWHEAQKITCFRMKFWSTMCKWYLMLGISFIYYYNLALVWMDVTITLENKYHKFYFLILFYNNSVKSARKLLYKRSLTRFFRLFAKKASTTSSLIATACPSQTIFGREGKVNNYS